MGNIYLSSAITQANITSSITGLGTVGYISSSQLLSTTQGLGNIYLSSALTQANITSSITGLGTLGYISSSQLTSTVTGIGTGSGINATQLTSSITGLGTVGYISSTQLRSTVNGLGTAGYVSSATLVSSLSNWSLYPAVQNVNMNYNIISNVQQINVDSISSATLGYTEFLNFINLQNHAIYAVTNLQVDSITANNYGVINFGNAVSFQTAVTFLNSVDMSSNGFSNVYFSEYIDLDWSVGTTGLLNTLMSVYGYFSYYNSNTAVPIAIASDWWRFAAAGTVVMNNNDITDLHAITGYGGYPIEFNSPIDMKNNSICNINSIFLSNPDAGDFTQLYFAPGANKELYYYDSNFGVSGAVAGSWWQYGAEGDVNSGNNNISNINFSYAAEAYAGYLHVNNITQNGNGYVQVDNNIEMAGNNITNVYLLDIYSPSSDNIDLTANTIYNNIINSSESGLIVNSALQINNTLNINAVGHNPMIQFQNGLDFYTIQAQTDNIGGVNTKAFGFSANINMNSNIISNIQVNYSNTFSNTSVAASLLSASPQTFSGAIYDQYIPTILFSNTITGSESNYLYFVKNQTMWKIHITMTGVFSTTDTAISIYFTLSNSTSAIETPFTIYTSNSPFSLYLPRHYQNVSLSLNDSVNLSDIINSSILPYTPISLNMYCSENANNFTSSNIGNWTNPINLSALTIGYGVAYGNNTWMVVGYESTNDCGYLATSYDNARTWVGTSLPITSTAYCVAYGNGIWVIGCDGGTGFPILYSTDGTNFNESSADLYRTRGVAYGNGVFVATGDINDVNVIIYSTDGKTWYAASENPYGGGHGVSYANGLFVVVGNDGGGAVFTSQDGIHWQQYGVSTNLVCCAYGAGRWFASDGLGNLYYSTDNWGTYSSISEPYYLASLAFGDTFVGIDSGTGIYSSSDFGNTWNSQSSSFNNAGYGIAYGNGVYVACGDNGDSNCISIAYATNSITYSLEPATIQPQTYVLPAPVIDWNNTYYDGGNLNIAWFSVPGATHYKIFLQTISPASGGTHYVNKYGEKATVVLKNSLTGAMFNSDSGSLSGNSYSLSASSGNKNNYFVFAYNNGVRSVFPSTQILDYGGILELWPVEQCEYHGGSNYANFTSVTARNLYTNQCMVVSSNDWVNNTFGTTQITQLGLDTFLSNH